MIIEDVFIFLVAISALSLMFVLAAAMVFIGRLTYEVLRHVLGSKGDRPLQPDRQARPTRRVFMVDQRTLEVQDHLRPQASPRSD